MMDSLSNNRIQTVSRRKRVRPSSCRMNHKTVVASLLLLVVAIATTHPSTAFVVPTTNGSDRRTAQTLTPTPITQPLYVSTLADMDTSDLLSSTEERPEDLLDLSKLPLLAIPKNGHKPLTVAKIPEEKEVLEWAGRYTSVEALREHFGTNKNKLWGDLQASTARRLYKTLLPRALLELSKLGKVHPQELAPLAYQARVAAKLYTRERSTVPARIAATLFDGFRQWIKYGKFQSHGMTYDQLWEKYAEKILHEAESKHTAFHHHHHDDDDEECDPFHSDCEELADQVSLKIIERACVSNEGVDAMALKGKHWSDETELEPHQRALLEQIRSQLEEDMYQLLLPEGHPDRRPQEKKEEPVRTRDRLREGKLLLVRGLARQRRFWKLQQARKEQPKAVNATDEKPWNMARSKPWLSRSKTATTALDEDDEFKP